jgi:hypothetical protein
MQHPSSSLVVLLVVVLVTGSAPLAVASVGGSEDQQVIASGPDGLHVAIVRAEGQAAMVRVNYFGQTDVPISDEEAADLEEFVREHGPIELTPSQMLEFEQHVQASFERGSHTNTPCSPEDFELCYEISVEQCEGEGSSVIGGGLGARLAAGTYGTSGALLGGYLAARAFGLLTCEVPVWIGCSQGCGTGGGGGCHPIGACYEQCPENTQPAGQRCRIGNTDGRCCTWNGPSPGNDYCVPPAICYDDICMGCPAGTIPGDGSCDANTHVGCGRCCIPVAG